MRTTTSARFDLKFFRVFSKFRLPGKLHFYDLSLEKLALLPLVKEVTPFPHRKMINLQDNYTFLVNCPPTPPLSQHFALSDKEVLMVA